MYNIPAATFHNVPNELASHSETTIAMRHGPLPEPSYNFQLQEHDKMVCSFYSFSMPTSALSSSSAYLK